MAVDIDVYGLVNGFESGRIMSGVNSTILKSILTNVDRSRRIHYKEISHPVGDSYDRMPTTACKGLGSILERRGRFNSTSTVS